MPDFRCAAVVLAAGASTRLGQPKQLVRIDGESLLHRTARLALEAGCSPVLVVLGFEADQLQRELQGLAVDVVVNHEWREGMGASLRSGMQALRKTDLQPQAVLILVCDQPRLTADHLRTLLARHQSARRIAITASVYARRAGVPALFSAKVFSALLASSGDRGAKDLIRIHAAQVQGIPWPAGELDLDLPEDLITIER
ncbi:MAG: nucleotidyltransferase family protein [Acidobacteriaceae bacterium]|jgi:molybdenum cofactor cytidylyltransferase